MITTAAELWTRWIDDGVMRPKDYDRDITNAVLDALGRDRAEWSRLAAHLAASAWSPRDLVRAMHPVLASFSGMLKDLLSLYTRVDATRTEKDPLRIRYEFERGDAIDDTLASFAETVQRVESVTREVLDVEYPGFPHVWHSPLRDALEGNGSDFFDRLHDVLETDPDGDLREWPFDSPVPMPDLPEDALAGELRRVGLLHHAVILGMLRQYLLHARTTNDFAEDRAIAQARDGAIDRLYFDTTDFWPQQQILLLQLLPEVVGRMTEADATALLAAQRTWLESFFVRTTVTEDELVESVDDVLALPHWGRRHDIYSAWIAAAIDRALEQRLVFDVAKGVLAFPFRPTLLARLSTAGGDVELWTERRFPATPPLGGGRKQGIQPDYVFLAPARRDRPLLAVEAKQYLRANSRNPGEAARDYARNLPTTTVIVAAHGPIGRKALGYVAPADQPRVQMRPHVRPGSVVESAKFGRAVADLFPAPAPAPTAVSPSDSPPVPERSAEFALVSLHWDATVEDLDLRLDADGDVVTWSNPFSTHAVLRADGFRGGPEIADLLPTGRPIRVSVRLYSSDVDSVAAARPFVVIVTASAIVRLSPAQSAAREWHVATVHPDGSVVPDASSVG